MSVITRNRKVAAAALRALKKGRPVKLLGGEFRITALRYEERPFFFAEIELTELVEVQIRKVAP